MPSFSMNGALAGRRCALEIGCNRKGPVTGLGAGLLGGRSKCLLVMVGPAGPQLTPLRSGSRGSMVGSRAGRGQRFPADAFAYGKAASAAGEIVDGGLLLVELVAVSGLPEKPLGAMSLRARRGP